MLDTTDMQLRKLVSFRASGFIFPSLILTFFASLLLLPALGFAARNNPAPDSHEVTQLKLTAEEAFVKGNYASAEKLDLEIAEKYPDTMARHYAVQMLGTIYEDRLIDIEKAIRWDREYLDKYAGDRQAPFYREKLAGLQKLVDQKQEQAFKAYQAIRFAQGSDEVLVKKLDALMKQYPDFQQKDEVLHDLAYAYKRLDDSKKSALAFQALGSNNLTPTDQGVYRVTNRYWQMRSTWAWVAWAVIAMLWAVVLWMKPWQRLTWASARKFILWPVLWLLVSAAGMPLFFNLDTTGYPVQMPLTTILIAVGLNLIVLSWLLLLLHGKSWLTRPRALRWLTPVLALLMTTGVFYLFVAYQPNGPLIVDKCLVKYDWCKSEFEEWAVRHNIPIHGEAEAVQDK